MLYCKRFVSVAAIILVLCAGFLPQGARAAEKQTLLLAAAASLRYSFDNDLIPMFQAQNPDIVIEATYDSSGKLQAQIENGLQADVFMSASPKQMNALVDKAFIEKSAVVALLENKIVLIAPADAAPVVKGFEEAQNAKSIAVGDPDSVPAGQYAREAFTSLGNWDAVLKKASLGTNVTEVLGWVSEASADIGVVYATDAATTDTVKVIATAPEGSLKAKVIYPVAVVKGSAQPDAAAKLVAFLQTPEAVAVFEKYGFAANK